MKRAFLFVVVGALFFLSAFASNRGAGAARAQTAGVVHYSMEYTLDRMDDGALSVDFRNIKGFDDIWLECVAEDRASAKVLTRLGLTPGSGTDASAPPRMTVILPGFISANPAVIIRFRNGIDGPIAFYLKFDPTATPRRGRIYLGNVFDDALVMSVPKCPPGCWLAQVVQPDPPPCIASKCCNNGGVTYNLTLCTITCHNGDCD
jgi:hypothetical protein